MLVMVWRVNIFDIVNWIFNISTVESSYSNWVLRKSYGIMNQAPKSHFTPYLLDFKFFQPGPICLGIRESCIGITILF